MVSPLSSRILNLEAKAGSVNCPPFVSLKHNTRQEWHRFTREKRVSGYSADKESTQSGVSASAAKQKRAELVGII